MSKQEEIREDIARTFYDYSEVASMIAWLDLPSEVRETFFRRADLYLCRLELKYGVVIKVKCPHCCWSQFKDEGAVGMTPCWHCDSTGYKFEPLIKEGK